MPTQDFTKIIFKFCPDCGCNKEHILQFNPRNAFFPHHLCSGCMPIAFTNSMEVRQVAAKSHTFRRCSKCQKLEEFIREGSTYICKGCTPEKFPTEKKEKEQPLKIKRPSKELA